MQRLYQQQTLQQKLSPQQIQLMKLLQVPSAQLEERVMDEIEENPALEFSENGDDDINQETDYTTENEDYVEGDEGIADEFEKLEISEYSLDSDEGDADYNYREDGYNAQEEKEIMPIKLEKSFYDILNEQLQMQYLSTSENTIAMHLIGSLDEDGYLRREATAIVDDLSFRQNIETTVSTVEKLIGIIQNFEPFGVAARNLQECLLIQLHKKTTQNNSINLAILIITKYFNEFTKKHYSKIQKVLNIDEDQMRDVINIIIKLNPKPGQSYQTINKAQTFIIPDFYIFNTNGFLELILNSKNAPELRVNNSYKDIIHDFEKSKQKNAQQKETVQYIKQKIDSAKWFIDAIKQRQHTLLLTMETIMRFQEEFFKTGDESMLRPMILKDIANRTGLDISTVSRVASSKYVQTEFGTYKIKYFFSEGLQTDNGEEVSTREVKNTLEIILQSEDKTKPLNDDVLAEMLKEKGFNIARRTVAKYREMLHIPVARLRKQI